MQQLHLIDENGTVHDISSDTLQTNSIDLAYNTVPELTEHETYFAQFGQQGFLPFQLLEDEDGHVLTYEITVFPMWQEVELEEDGFQITYTSFDFDQFSYKACDLWGDCDFGTVYLDVGLVGATTQIGAKDVQYLAIFPQVTTQSLQLDVSFFEQEMLTLEIFNQKGQSMRVEKMWASDAVNFDVSDLVAGHYFIVVRGEASRGLARFSKL